MQVLRKGRDFCQLLHRFHGMSRDPILPTIIHSKLTLSSLHHLQLFLPQKPLLLQQHIPLTPQLSATAKPSRHSESTFNTDQFNHIQQAIMLLGTQVELTLHSNQWLTIVGS